MLSVVVPARDAGRWLGECLDALISQEPPPAEIVVVDDGSRDDTPQVARDRGVRVVRLDRTSGPSAARNAGVAETVGNVVAFVDADDVVLPGWSAAIEAAFAAGHGVAATRLMRAGDGSVSQRFLAELAGPSERVRFASAAAGGQLVVRRDVFVAARGFDEGLRCAEDIDLSLRLVSAGHDLHRIDDAVVVRRERDTIRGMLAQRARWAYWWPFLGWKWQHHKFVLARGRIRQSPLLPLARAATDAAAGRYRRSLYGALEAAAEAAWTLGRWVGAADLYLGRRRPPTPHRGPAGRGDLTPPLPEGPAAILVGRPSSVRLLARGLRAGSHLASPPPGLFDCEPWDAPAPWARRLVDRARQLGWRLVPDVAARRLHWERPDTYGGSAMVLHAVFAWLHSKDGFVVSASAAAADLVERFGGVPVVAVGATDVRADVVVPPRLLRRPAEVARLLNTVADFGDPDRIAAGLRFASIARWRP